MTSAPSGPDGAPAADPGRAVGYAVVGLGRISQLAMLPAFANARANARLTALVSGDAAKRHALARRYGLPVEATFDYDDYDACLARDDVDAVYIALPNHLHRDFAVRAAARGVHVLCEKPLAPTGADCDAMIRACRDADVRLMVAYRLHLDPANLRAVELVEAGRIGEPRAFDSVFTLQVDAGDIRMTPAALGGGPLHDLGVYCVNAARYLFRAEPVAGWAMRATRRQPRFEDTDEMLTCGLRFPGGRLATFTCSFGAHPACALRLVGDEGELRMENPYHYRGGRVLEVRREAAGSRRDENGAGRGTVEGAAAGAAEAAGGLNERVVFPETDQFGAQLGYFSDCVLEGRDPEPDGEEGAVDVRILEALLESADTGRVVEIEVRTRDRRPGPALARRHPATESPPMVEAAGPSGDRRTGDCGPRGAGTGATPPR